MPRLAFWRPPKIEPSFAVKRVADGYNMPHAVMYSGYRAGRHQWIAFVPYYSDHDPPLPDLAVVFKGPVPLRMEVVAVWVYPEEIGA